MKQDTRQRTGGVEDACRDRWENILSIRACGREEKDQAYMLGLLGELESYYHHGIMPPDVREQYEKERVELVTCFHCRKESAFSVDCPYCGQRIR